jgi:hypothetical protein
MQNLLQDSEAHFMFSSVHNEHLSYAFQNNPVVAKPYGSTLLIASPPTEHDPGPVPTYLPSIQLNITSHFLLNILCGHFPRGFPTKILSAFLVSPITAKPTRASYTSLS